MGNSYSKIQGGFILNLLDLLNEIEYYMSNRWLTYSDSIEALEEDI